MEYYLAINNKEAISLKHKFEHAILQLDNLLRYLLQRIKFKQPHKAFRALHGLSSIFSASLVS